MNLSFLQNERGRMLHSALCVPVSQYYFETLFLAGAVLRTTFTVVLLCHLKDFIRL